MIEYQFPVVTFYGDDYEDAKITMHSAAIDPKILDHEPYPLSLLLTMNMSLSGVIAVKDYISVFQTKALDARWIICRI